MLVRAVGVALGIFMMAIAPLLALATPILPVGLPVFILGLLLVAATSKTAHRIITNYLRRHPGLWNRVKRAFGEHE